MFGLRRGKKAGGSAGERIQSLSAQGLAGPELISELRHEGFKPGEVDRGFRDVLKRAAVPDIGGVASSVAGRLQGRAAGAAAQSALEPAAGRAGWETEGLGLPPAPGLGAPARERVFREEPEPGLAGAAETLPGLPPMPVRPRAFGGGPQLQPEELNEEVDVDEFEDEDWGGPGEAPAPRRAELSSGMAGARLERIDSEFEELQERMERMEGRLHVLEQRVPGDLEKRETEALRMVSEEQKRSLGEVTMRMEALEKVLKDSLGPMMQTMRSLSDTLKAMKGQRET